MQRPSVFTRSCCLVVALALFAVRLADAHVHVCLDGSEPSMTVHFADAGIHPGESHVPQEHYDQDVKFVVEGVFKKGEFADLWVSTTLWSPLDLLSPYTVEPTPYVATPPPLSSRSQLRPPLRGPPR